MWHLDVRQFLTPLGIKRWVCSDQAVAELVDLVQGVRSRREQQVTETVENGFYGS
jgi:hypothetical protein